MVLDDTTSESSWYSSYDSDSDYEQIDTQNYDWWEDTETYMPAPPQPPQLFPFPFDADGQENFEFDEFWGGTQNWIELFGVQIALLNVVVTASFHFFLQYVCYVAEVLDWKYVRLCRRVACAAPFEIGPKWCGSRCRKRIRPVMCAEVLYWTRRYFYQAWTIIAT
jgi:hypothetical protein